MCDQEEKNDQKISIPMIFILGLSTGLVNILMGIVFASPYFGINLPLLLVAIIAMVVLGNIPTQLFILKFIARKDNKKIKDIILFKNKTPIIKYILSIIITLIIAVIVFVLLESIEGMLWDYLKIFNFIPDWYKMELINYQEYNNMKIIIVLFYLLNGLWAPIVEEIYFRGYLLPRMGIFGKFAPLMNIILFSIYHFHSPRQIITRIIALTPMAYSVWINKDIKIGIFMHCLLNLGGTIGLVLILFK
jgi:membrane protease YdiL (CAAX protease family)